MGILPLLISCDDPARNQKFRQKLSIPFPLLSDENHTLADGYGIPISRKHLQSGRYPDGFYQPAIFIYGGEKEVFTFIQKPSMWNLWGAARRPTPAQVIGEVEGKLTPAKG